MKNITIILGGAGLVVGIVALSGLSFAIGKNNNGIVNEAVARATAAVIYNGMTPTVPVLNVPAGTPTLSMQDIALTQIAYQQALDRKAEEGKQKELEARLASELAIKMKQLDVEQAQIEAESQAALLKAQQESAEKTAVANRDMLTAVKADEIHAGETAIAGTVSAGETAIAGSATAKIQPTADLLTLEAAKAIQTIEAANAEKAALEVRRISATNMFQAFIPFALIAAFAWIGGRGFQTWVKTRTHPRDEHGRAQTFQRELPDGGVVIVKPDAMETGIVKVTNEGNVIRYAPMDPAEQKNINRGNLIADIVGQLPAPYAKSGQSLLSKFAGEADQPQRIPSIEVVSPEKVGHGILDEIEAQVVEES